MQRSRTQEASVTKDVAEQAPERTTPEQTPERTQQTEPAPQDPQIRERDLGQMIQEQQERQREWQRDINPDRDKDLGFGIE
jgi:hypothetical protein